MKPLSIISLAMAGCLSLAAAAPPGQELFELLRKDGEAVTLTDRIRATRSSMEALLAADHDTLFGALELAIAEGRFFRTSQALLVEQCARLDPGMAVAALAKIRNPDLYRTVGCLVWGTIARSDPDRAAAAVQRVYQPGDNFNRATLQTAHCFYGLVGPVMEEVGAAWFRRDGLAVMKKLGALPHADDLDDPLFRGICGAVETAEQRLALLDWMTGPAGQHLTLFEKGSSSWSEEMLGQAALEDLAKTRAWVERRFPPGTTRKSDQEADWDITHFRHALFSAWAKSAPRQAADWLVAQVPEGDRDAASSFFLCFDTLRSSPHGGLEMALDWLVQFTEREAFAQTANHALAWAAEQASSDKSLALVMARFATLPLALRERIVTQPPDDPFETLDSGPVDERVLRGLFPVAEDRQRIEQKLGVIKPAPDEPKPWSGPFKLAERQPAARSTPDSLAQAKRLVTQHADCQHSRDPQGRLAGVAALEWLAQATSGELARILQAHLENRLGVMDGFAAEVIEAWTRREWRSCEQFAWTADHPDHARQNLLIATFQAAATVAPDEVFARLNALIAEGRLRSKALDLITRQSSGGWHASASDIPKRLGAGWIANDGPAGVAKMKALPAGWIRGAIAGAAGSIRTAEAGVAVLDWLVQLDAAEPDSKEGLCTGFHRSRWSQASPVFSRLVAIDLDAAIRWLEASPVRLAKSDNVFDGFSFACRAFFDRDPAAAAEWARRVRPDTDITWWIVSAMAKKDEAKALAWLDAHPDDPNLDSGLEVLINRWEIPKPAAAAKLVARLSKPLQVNAAAHLAHPWQRLDPAAAGQFLDQTFAGSPTERQAVEAEMKRLDEYARDRQE